MVNHLATNMATNMTELMAMLRNQNQASSSFTPPPEHRLIVDPNPTIPPTFVSEVEDASFSAMAYTPTVHPMSDLLPPPPAPTAVSLPPAALLSANSTMQKLPPLTVSMHPPIYTVPPPTVPPVTIAQASAPTADQFPFQAAPPALPTSIPPEAENEQERRIKRMKETIQALQVGNSGFDFDDSNRNLFPGMQLSPKIKILDFKRYDGTRNPRHNLRNNTIMFGLNKVDPRLRDLLSWLNVLQPLELNRAMLFHRFLAGNTIKTEALGPSFDLTVQNQNLHCEFHRDAPGHTLDNCWTLRNKIQEMINTRQISFNEVKPPNVRANPFPDHGLGSGPSINMIRIAAIGEDEHTQKTPIPFVINHAPTEVVIVAVPFVIEVLSHSLSLCAPEFNLVGARMREIYATRLGSVHFPGDTRRTRLRRSRHLLFTTRRSRAVESPGSRGMGYT
ncbi:hypothetical protein CRG98_016100 [Punica granatum]|uniref:Retrotransposon gag domain-containing protein n=1 Tax=Punica granatum TaxID=22663 RepID=A0A2I0K5L2_PUNGR|nr:hypothetical protein CRG98_016100 [Punica granatum]